jgi:hypothetical protein
MIFRDFYQGGREKTVLGVKLRFYLSSGLCLSPKDESIMAMSER